MPTTVPTSAPTTVPTTAPHSTPTGPTTTASAPGGTPSSIQGLNDAAKAAGKLYMGTATDNSELTDTAYTAILDNIHQFGQLTPANSMKWVCASSLLAVAFG